MSSSPQTDQVFAAMDRALSAAELTSDPFPHFLLPDFLDPETASNVLDWLEQSAPWTLQTSNFYIQHGSGKLADCVSGTKAAAVASPIALQIIRKNLERVFGTRLCPDRGGVIAHRLLPGHRIGVHNDCPAHGTETHRFLINLNRGFEDSYGGHLVLLDKDDPSGSTVIVRPLHNSAAAFELSGRSWHCVEEVTGFERYSLIYAFWTLQSVSAAENCESRAPAPGADPELCRREFQRLVGVLRDLGANTIPHSNRHLIDHLIGTWAILQRWRCDLDVCVAGLFHSVFGTRAFPRALVNDESMDLIRDAIGERPFALVRFFKLLNPHSLAGLVRHEEQVVDGSRTVRLTTSDVQDLVSLHWANAVEQLPFVEHTSEQIEALKSFYGETVGLLPQSARDEIRAKIRID